MEITVSGARIHIGRRQERELLALLLLDAGRWISVDRIVGVLWTDEPPAAAHRTVLTYVSRLRRVLRAAGAPELLERRGDAYRMAVDPQAVDCHRFDGQTRRAAGLADPAERAAAYGDALRLWSGPALTDAPALKSLAAAWEGRRRQAQRGRYAADLDAGRASELIGEITALAEADPLDEDATALLMRALTQAGRRNDALAAFTRLRVRLNEELGLDPGPAVTALHEQVLRGEVTVPVAARVVPAQLPAEPRRFAARGGDLARLADLMKRPGGPAVLTIAGLAGVGKTTLAVSLAHRLRDTYPDGQLYLDLRGFSPSGLLDADDALYALLIGLGVAPAAMPPGFDARAGLYRSLLAGRRILVVLDNARSADQIRPLLPPGGTSAALVTSRNRLTGLAVTHDAQPFELPLLDEASARLVLAAHVGRHRMDREPAAVASILAHCAGLPLALAVLGAHAVARPRHRLADIVRQLDETPPGADAATDVNSVFSWSYRRLSGPAARIFRRMSVIHNGELTLPAARSLVGGAGSRDLRQALDELADAGLLTELGPDRFGSHDLLTAYATELAAAHEDPAELDAARLRLYRHYHDTAWQARMLVYPSEPSQWIPGDGGVSGHLRDAEDARHWYVTERVNLVHAVADAAGRGWDALAVGLGLAITFFLDRAGHWQDWVRMNERLLPIAEKLGDPSRLGFLQRSLGYGYIRFGREDEAETRLRDSIETLRRSDDRRGLGNALNGLAHLYDLRGDHEGVRAAAQASYQVYTEAGAVNWAAGSINAIAWAEVNLGELDAAIGHCRQALDMLEQGGFAETTHAAATWDTYGVALHRLGRYAEARDAYGRAADLCQRSLHMTRLLTVRTHLGDCASDAGDRAGAAVAYRQALELAETIDATQAERLRAKLRGR